jgi:AAHS family 4-hydroxybenzoate transporter-like MFS transporter
MPARTVNLTELIDGLGLTAYQVRVVALCALVAALDGYDTQAIGYTGPLLAKAFGFELSALAVAVFAGLFGAMIGAFAFGPLADWIGRKVFLVISTLVFAAFTLATVYISTLPELVACRFLAGLGLGGATPSFLALAVEYAPRPKRATVATVLYAAFPLGGVVGGVLGSYLIPTFGWQAVFYVGAVLPLATALLLMAWLPESLRFLLVRGHRQHEAYAIIERIAPGAVGPNDILTFSEESEAKGFPVRVLLTEGRATITFFLWALFFFAFMQTVVLGIWIAPLLNRAGVAIASTGLIVAGANLGSVFGSALSGQLIDKFGAVRTLIPAAFLGAVSTAAFAIIGNSVPVLITNAIMSGFLVGGASTGLLALAATIYPTQVRSTGIGWAMAFGRFGQVFVPLGIGAMLGANWQVTTILIVCGLPALLDGLVLILLGYWLGNRDIAPTIPRPSSMGAQ